MEFDVSIIGAGAEGLATAICCAEAGQKVCVLERSNFPRPCVGESVHPGAEALFRVLGVAGDVSNARFLRYSGIWISRDGRKEFNAFGGNARQPWEGFHLWRPDFDRILLNRAKTAGAVCIERCNPSYTEVFPRSVTVHSNVGPIESAVVVDGTGRSRWLARQLGLKVETHSRPLIARYGYRQGYCPTCSDDPMFVSRPDETNIGSSEHVGQYPCRYPYRAISGRECVSTFNPNWRASHLLRPVPSTTTADSIGPTFE